MLLLLLSDDGFHVEIFSAAKLKDWIPFEACAFWFKGASKTHVGHDWAEHKDRDILFAIWYLSFSFFFWYLWNVCNRRRVRVVITPAVVRTRVERLIAHVSFDGGGVYLSMPLCVVLISQYRLYVWRRQMYAIVAYSVCYMGSIDGVSDENKALPLLNFVKCSFTAML